MDLVNEVAAIVEQWGQERYEFLREKIAEKGHNANGDTFAASFIPLEVEIGEDYCTWKLQGPAWYEVLDKGGKRWTNKMPPIKPIMDWIAHKGYQPKQKKTLISTIKSKSNSVSAAIKRKTPKSWHDQPKYKAYRSMAFAIAMNIKKKGMPSMYGGRGSNFYSETFSPEAFLDLRRRIIEKTANPEFIFQFIDPDK